MELHKSDGCTCNQCGKCCQAFLLSTDVHEHSYPDDPKFDNWVKKYVVPIGLKEVQEILGLTAKQKDLDEHNRRFYKCKALGPDNLCTIYKDRPYTCSGYPFYGDDVVEASTLLYKKCGYGEIQHKENE